MCRRLEVSIGKGAGRAARAAIILAFAMSLTVVAVPRVEAATPEQVEFVRNYQNALYLRDWDKMRRLARGLQQYDLYEITVLIVDKVMYMRCRNEDDSEAQKIAVALAGDFSDIYKRDTLRAHVQKMLLLPREQCKSYTEVISLTSAARKAEQSSQFTKAATLYKQSLSLAKKLNNKEIEVVILNELFTAETSREDPDAALRYVIEAAEMIDQVAYPGVGYAVTCNAGKANGAAGRYADAVKYYEQCLSEAQNTTLPARAKFVPYAGLTEAYVALRDKENARRYWEQTLQTRQEQPESFFFNSVIHLAANVAERGDTELSRTMADAVKDYAEKPTLPDMERFAALGAVAVAYQSGNDAQSAKRYASRAAVLARTIGNEQAFAIASLALAHANVALNEPTEALNGLKESYRYLEKAPASFTKLDTMRMIADLSLQNGETEQWAFYIARAYEEAVAAKLQPYGAKLALVVAEESIIWGNTEQAATYIDKVLSGEVPANRRYKAIAYAMRGRLFRADDKPELALPQFLKALRLQTGAGLAHDEALTLLKIARVYIDMQNAAQAEQYLGRVDAAPLKEAPRLAELAQTIRARIAYETGHLGEGIEYFAGVYERQRQRAYVERFSLSQRPTVSQAEFRANTLAYSEMLLRAADQSPESVYARRAFVVTEQGKSINFQQLLSRYLLSESGSLDKDTRKKIQDFNALLLKKNDLESSDKGFKSTFVPGGQESLKKIDDKMKALSGEIRQTFPRFDDQTKGVDDVADVQQLLRPGEAIISYSVRPKRSAVFVVTQDNFHCENIPLGKAGIRAKVAEVLKGVRNVVDYQDLSAFSPRKAEGLYQLLFLPVEKHLKSARKIIIVGDDVLNTLPFEMLVTKSPSGTQAPGSQASAPYLSEYTQVRYLADEHAFTYLPSAAMFVAIRKHSPYALWTRSFVAFADPDFEDLNKSLRTIRIDVRSHKSDLEGQLVAGIYTKRELDLAFTRLENTKNEAVSIARIAGGTMRDLYLGKRATEANVRKTPLEHTRFLLFATHGVVPTDRNGLEQAALALVPTMYREFGPANENEDGLLTTSDVMRLKLSAELVVLSACDTAGSDATTTPGEGFVGLTRAFMFAGAKNLVVSHWPVESESTQRLMVELFKRRLHEKKLGDVALNEAKKALRAQTGEYPDHQSGAISYAHPFFWAPFVWVGTY